MPMVHVGDRALDFTARSQAGQPVALSEFLGSKAVVLFFYPKDAIVRHVFSSQFAAGRHVAEALAVVRELAKG